MLISIARADRYLSVSDIVSYICEFESFDKYFEIIEERITHTILSSKDMECKIAALEFTLSVMTVSYNIHSNMFTEQLLTNQFHKTLFKYLKREIKEIQQQYNQIKNGKMEEQNGVSASNELVKQHEKKENKQNEIEKKQKDKEKDEDSFKEEEFILQQLQNKPLLMLVLSNLMLLCHYQRFESDNIALKYISSIKVLPNKVKHVHILIPYLNSTFHTSKCSISISL